MKKLFFCIVTIMLVVLMSGCQNKNYNDTSNTSEKETNSNNDTNIQDSVVPDDLYNFSFSTFVCGKSEELNGIPITIDDRADEFLVSSYHDDTASQKKNMTIFGKDQNAVYEGSIYDPFVDKNIHTYTIPNLGDGLLGVDYPTVSVDAATGDVLHYSLFPYDSELTKEEDYINYVKKVVGDKFDLSKLSYSVTTNYIVRSENGFSTHNKEGFYVCGENERLISYNMSFVKCINGIPTVNGVGATFSEDFFGITINNTNFDEKLLLGLSSETEELNESVISHVNRVFSKSCIVTDCSIESKSLFVKDGIPYVKANVKVGFKYNKDDEALYYTFVTTITEITVNENTASK